MSQQIEQNEQVPVVRVKDKLTELEEDFCFELEVQVPLVPPKMNKLEVPDFNDMIKDLSIPVLHEKPLDSSRASRKKPSIAKIGDLGEKSASVFNLVLGRSSKRGTGSQRGSERKTSKSSRSVRHPKKRIESDDTPKSPRRKRNKRRTRRTSVLSQEAASPRLNMGRSSMRRQRNRSQTQKLKELDLGEDKADVESTLPTFTLSALVRKKKNDPNAESNSKTNRNTAPAAGPAILKSRENSLKDRPARVRSRSHDQSVL